MNIKDSYIHGADGKGVVKSLYFANSVEEILDRNGNAYSTTAGDLVFQLADIVGTKIGLPIPTWNQNTTGYAASVLVQKRDTNANHYLVFADSNNDNADAESLYTDGDIIYNPSTNLLTVKKITVNTAAGFNYSAIETGAYADTRCVWFSDSALRGIPVINTNFTFNPAEGPTGHVGTLHVNNITGDNIAITIGTTRVALGGTYTPDTSISSSSTNNTIPSSLAVYNAIINGIGTNDAMVFKGILVGGETAGTTTYTPAADCGHTYKVGTAGYINGVYYNVNDTFICSEDSTAAANSTNVSTVSANWGVVEGNGDYLNIHGGTMYGTLKWANATALPSSTAADYILVVDATSNGTTKYITKANFKTALSITDKTGIKLGTVSGTAKTDSTVIIANSSTGLTIAGGTNLFKIGDGTNYISVPINHGLSTLNIKINGTNYAIYTSESSLPTFFAPTALAETGGYILATNSAKTGLEWVAKPATNVTTSAVLADAANSTTQLSASQANPFYNLIEGGTITRSVQFVAGEGMAIGTTDGSDVKITNTAPIYYIKGNADTTAGTWTGTDSRISAYYEGLTIVFVPQIAGASTTTLNINGFGAKTCYFTNTSKLTTHYAVGTPIVLTYYANTWRRADYDSNSNTWRGIRVNNNGSDNVGTGTGTKSMNFASGSLTIGYLAAGTGTGQSGNANYFTIGIEAKDWTGATADAAGTAGYMPGAAAADYQKFLRGDGTWVALSEASHTHPLSIAADSGTNQLTLAASTKYKLTAGGSTFIFTTPPNTWVANAVGVAGYVAAPTAANNKNYVWMTDANGNPAWRAVTAPATVPTLAWNTEASLGTVGAITFKVKLPVNPNVTTTAVLSNASNGTTHITGTLANPYYNLVEGSSVTRSIRFVAGNGITVSAATDGQITITNSKPDVNHNTDYTTLNKGTAGSTTAVTQVKVASSTGVTLEGGTNKFKVGNGTNYFEIPITVSTSAQATELFNGSKTLSVSSWTTIARVDNLDAGTYAILINAGTLYASGVFTACGGTDVVIDEIVLHVGNSTSGATWRPYARISGSNLEMSSNEATGTSRTYIIKIFKLI